MQLDCNDILKMRKQTKGSEKKNKNSRIKNLNKWQICLFAFVIVCVVIFGALTLKERSNAAEKAAEYKSLVSQAEQYEDEAQEISEVIESDGSAFDEYMYDVLRLNGYGRPNEVWNINSEFGN